jgi:hypothetical protein
MLVDTAAAFGDQIRKELFSGATASVSVNRLFGGSFIAGAGAGYRRETNGGDLDEVEVETTTEETDPTSGAVRVVRTKVAARQGAYTERDTYPLTLDAFWIPAPGDPIALTAYGRQVLSNAKPITRLGFGLWALKPGAPSQSLGGLVVELDDVFENAPEAKTAEARRFKVSLVVGLPMFSR